MSTTPNDLAARRASFLALVEPHVAVLHRTAYHMTGRADRADDAMQDLYLHAWRALDTYDPARPARAWLFTILRHVIYDARRRRRRDGRILSLDEVRPEGVEGRDASPGDGLIDEEVAAAVARLPEDFRDVILRLMSKRREDRFERTGDAGSLLTKIAKRLTG